MPEWPKGHSEKHAAAARKGWETRRRNAEAAGIAIGETVGHAKRPTTKAREASPKTPLTTAEKRRAAYAPKREKYWALVVYEHIPEPDAYRAVGGGISVKDRAAAKAKAGFYYRHVVTTSRYGMVSGHDVKERY